jgi:hypothetical protein
MLSIDGSPFQKVKMYGYTVCSGTAIFCYNALLVSPGAIYQDPNLGDYIGFEQQSRKVFHQGYLINIVATLTHTDANDCQLMGMPCRCRILGDGQKHHFGTNRTDHPPATVYMNCTLIRTPKEHTQ